MVTVDWPPLLFLELIQSDENDLSKVDTQHDVVVLLYSSRMIGVSKEVMLMHKGLVISTTHWRIRKSLEKDIGRVVTLSCWAEAAKIEEKLLQQHLHFGWCCLDELIRSTRSLVLYFARNYRGVGISLKDLLQAGSVSVLQGAERFDILAVTNSQPISSTG
ncbi:hypothetical protein FEM48_Zijuj06G0026500 [Ziziphus jujuba var. spinosa]|uniref:RNA polymerase sigma-70 region 2 domain-containing protein n=1 Tax=Ziziphus jujuba var. spinosa TaxID=714518 RepID=A0A978V6P0_ZIZJJ|nr:hypothetical protein FEM48_Zijuj06G0026500 [Ziziphus jujuba var. spinosa]